MEVGDRLEERFLYAPVLFFFPPLKRIAMLRSVVRSCILLPKRVASRGAVELRLVLDTLFPGPFEAPDATPVAKENLDDKKGPLPLFFFLSFFLALLPQSSPFSSRLSLVYVPTLPLFAFQDY